MAYISMRYYFTDVANRILWEDGVVASDCSYKGKPYVLSSRRTVLMGSVPTDYYKYRPTKATITFYGRALGDEGSTITVRNGAINWSAKVSKASAATEHTLEVVPTSNKCLDLSQMTEIYFEATNDFTLWADTGTSVRLIIEYELIPYRTVAYFTGEEWVQCIVHYYDGTRWVQCDPYYHDGSGYISCSHIK